MTLEYGVWRVLVNPGGPHHPPVIGGAYCETRQFREGTITALHDVIPDLSDRAQVSRWLAT